MKRELSALTILAALVLVAFVGLYQAKQPQQSVVVYTSVDQVYSEPILKEFERKTGIRVLAVYDVEATKTTGLVNRLIAEENRPQADVFWNGEFVQTMLLKQEGILSPYSSPASSDMPSQYVDPGGYWAVFGGRARVLLVNTDLVAPGNYPRSIFDLLSPEWPSNEIGVAYPLFGTSATHAAALYALVGPDRARDFYNQLKSRGVRVVDGNSVVRDMVASGELSVGLTDTDDACKALENGAPVAIIFPDQGQDGIGTLVIPNTVALIANAPHPTEGQALIDYLLSREVEQQLIVSGWFQFSLRTSGVHSTCLNIGEVKGMNVTFAEIFGHLQEAREDLSEIFIR